MAPWSKPKLRPLTAAATRILPEDTAWERRWSRIQQEWQRRAWAYSETVGEAGFVHHYMGNAVSRIRLVASEFDGEGKPVPTENKAAIDALEALKSETGGHSALMYSMAFQLGVPGETFLVGVDGMESAKYDVLSNEELKPTAGGGWERIEMPGETGVPISKDALIVRIWQPSQRHRLLAESRMRGVLDSCEVLQRLGEVEIGTLASRLANAKVFGIPEEATVAPSQPRPEGVEGEESDFVDDLVTHFSTPTRDLRSASVLTPFVVRAKGQHLKEMVVLDLGKDFTEHHAAEVKAARERLAIGLDFPPEVLLGTAGLNHWGSWQVEEASYKAHIEPRVIIIAEGLTVGYYRPVLEERKVPDSERFLVWFDSTELITTPDRTEDMTTGVKIGAVGLKKWRTEAGVGEEDAPTPDELETIRSLLGKPDLAEGPSDRPEPDRGPPSTAAATRTPDPVRLSRRLARIERGLFDRLGVSADAAVRRALEKAGARVRSRVAGNSTRKGTGEVLAGVENFRVAAVLGPKRVGALGIEDDDLLEGEAEEWCDRAMGWIVKGQNDVATALNGDPDDDAWRRGAGEARVALLAGMTAFLRARLYDPDPAPPKYGEFDGIVAPRKVIREALVSAGGGPVLDRELAGLSSGAIAEDLIGQLGLKTAGFTWTHDAPLRDFPAHAALDGVEFAGWDDDVLVVRDEDSWLDRTHYAPGDHDGCLCSFDVLLETANGA